ncbi:MAG: hypothetical protein MUC87_09520 [Bacteroidia bacterium]|jgi:hypothetical protein|nr:hypothetical protein [Bacteroidia bacterium]
MTKPRHLTQFIAEYCLTAQFIGHQKNYAIWMKGAILLPFALFATNLQAQLTDQQIIETYTTAEKDSLNLAMKQEDTAVIAIADTVMTTVETEISYDRIIPVNYNCCFTPETSAVYEYSAASPQEGLTQFAIFDRIADPESQGNIALRGDEYEYYLALEKIRRITKLFSRRVRAKKYVISVHFPCSKSESAILPPEARIALPETRRKNKYTRKK